MVHKYRVYVEQYKEMCDVLCIDFVNDACWVLPRAELEGGGTQVEVKGLDKLRMFTGMKDKNHKDIYHRDIVRSHKHNPHEYLIRYIEGAFCATNNQISDYPIDLNHFYDSKGCMIEVVGNMDQNIDKYVRL